MCVVPVSQWRKEQLLEDLENDPVCQQLDETIVNEWLKRGKSVPVLLRLYFTFRDESSCPIKVEIPASQLL